MSVLLVSHVGVSLLAILFGFFVVFAFLSGKRHETWMSFFLATTTATSVTGFLFPADKITPGHVFGVLSLLALGIAVATRNDEKHLGAWSRTHIVSILVSFYLNAFVLVVQLFQKVPDLKALAPTQSEPPFALSQLALLSSFLLVGYLSFRRNRLLQVKTIKRVLQVVTNRAEDGTSLARSGTYRGLRQISLLEATMD